MNSKAKILGIVPARGGSKSIPRKNIARINGVPLLVYAISAAKSSSVLDKIVCSTDCDEISQTAIGAGVEVIRRPTDIATDTSPVSGTVAHVLEYLKAAENYEPDIFALIQPTSPFVLPDHFRCGAKLLRDNIRAQSFQTVTTIPHNHHAINQRHVIEGYVDFRFREERVRLYNKQQKPVLYAFGNLVMTRVGAFTDSNDVFASPSVPMIIAPEYAIDVDRLEDIALAEWYLQSGRVLLPHV